MTVYRFYTALAVPLALAACSTAPSVDLDGEQQAVIAPSDSVVAQEMAAPSQTQ